MTAETSHRTVLLLQGHHGVHDVFQAHLLQCRLSSLHGWDLSRRFEYGSS
eukprot:EC716696.1.p5 GENE.EC716696.1~~EC716696.1.p5  ORF type:complete len:50 (-),score=3.51 EC716696.1:309-458(-)